MAMSLADLLGRIKATQDEPDGSGGPPRQQQRRVRGFQREEGTEFRAPAPPQQLPRHLQQHGFLGYQNDDSERDSYNSHQQEMARRHKMEKAARGRQDNDDCQAREREWDLYLAEQLEKSTRKHAEWEHKRQESIYRAQLARQARLCGLRE